MLDPFFRPYMPGFRVRPQDDVPGFNLDENGVPQQETTWSAGMPPGTITPQYLNSPQTPAPPPDMEEPAEATPPQLPEWLYKLATMLPPWPSTVFDPRTDQRTAINSLPGMGPAAASGTEQWPSANLPRQPVGIAIQPRATSSQNTNPQPPTQGAMSNVWLQPPRNGWPLAQAAGASPQDSWSAEITRQPTSLPSILTAKPLADSNFIFANADDAGGQLTRQQIPPLQQYQQTQQRVALAPRSTGPAMAPPPERPSIDMTGLERGPERGFSQVAEAYRRLKEAEGRQPISDERSLQPISPVLNTSSGDNLASIGSAQAQKPGAATQIGQPSSDASGLPNGAIISRIGPPVPYLGNAAINLADFDRDDRQSSQGSGGAASGIVPGDLNVHLVGDGDTPSDLSSKERHELGVQASIATHIERGFEVVVRKQPAVDVPGFRYPRYYDYIIRDPATGLHYGVEVKTTLYETIQLKPSQVMKDAAVVAQGARVRISGLELSGVSYSTYCFGCEKLDLRSFALRGVLEIAGVPVTRGTLPGDIRR